MTTMRLTVPRVMAAVVTMMVVVMSSMTPVANAAPHRETPDPALELARRYAPIMMLQQQLEPCGPGEPFEPIAVDAVLDNPEVALRQVGADDPVERWAASAQDVASRGGGFYLDSPGHALEPGCLYETDGRRFNAGRPASIYARVRPPVAPDEPLVVQYWFYWYFNQWNNDHEGDWEGIQILFEADTAEEALTVGPFEVGYAQHDGGESAPWGDDKIELDEGRPVVYSSAGSHASYFESATFLGRGASTGFGCDDTTGPSRRVDPEVILLPADKEDAEGSVAWLTFSGRWGERGPDPFDGPSGPADNPRWADPIGWQGELRDGSLTVPGSGSVAASIVDVFCAVVGWGSGQVIELQIAPWRVLVPVALLGLVAVVVIRRTSWRAVPSVPVIRSRSNGEILRASVRLIREQPARVLLPAAVALPLGGIIGAAFHLVAALPVVDDLVDLLNPTRAQGLTRVFGSLVTGALGVVIAMWFMVAAMSQRLDELEADTESSFSSMVRHLGSMTRPLLLTMATALVPIVLLVALPLGLPVAFWAFVRWWLAPVMVVREGLSGWGALRASARATSGRFWSVAAMALVTHALVVGGGIVVGLVVLTTATGLPLWTLTGVIVGTSAVLTPVAATTMVLVYGSTQVQATDESELELQLG